MRFRCERCRAKYRVEDELIAGRVRRIRCRRCSNVMTLRGQRAVGAPADGTVMSGPPPQMSDIAWFVRTDGETTGPFTEDVVVRMFHDGTLGSHTPLWHDAMADWTRLVDVPDFAVLFTPRRRLKAKGEREADPGTVVDFLRATEPITQDGSMDLLDDDDSDIEVDPDPTTPQDMFDRSDIDGEPVSLDLSEDRAGETALDEDELLFSDEGEAESDDATESDKPAENLEATSAPPTPVDQAPHPGERTGTDQYVAASGIGGSRWKPWATLGVVGVLVAGAATLAGMAAGDDDAKVTVIPVEDSRARRSLLAPIDDTLASGVDIACLAEGNCLPPEEEPDSVALASRAYAVGGPVSDPREAGRIRDLLAGRPSGGLTIQRRGPSVVPTVGVEAAIVPDASDLSSDDVAVIVARGVSAVRFCVERQPAVPSAAGRQLLRVTAAPSGGVVGARFESALLNATPLGECITRAAGRWRFPAFRGGPVDIRVPLVLGG